MDTSIASVPTPSRWRALRLLAVMLLAPLCWGADVLAISSVSSAVAAAAAIPISVIDEVPVAPSTSAVSRRRTHVRRRRFDDRPAPLPAGRVRTALLGLAPMRIRLMPPLWRGPPVLRL